MADYKKLEVWRLAQDIAVATYRLTGTLPSNEKFNLASQIQRSAVSIVANVAEGAGRGTDLDFARFIRIAIGSLSELRALLDLAEALGYLQLDESFVASQRDLHVRLLNLTRKLEADGRQK